MYDILIKHMQDVLILYASFGIAFAANIAFSLYKNIALLKEKFNIKKLMNGLIKAVILIIGTILLVASIVVVTEMCVQYGITSDEFSNTVNVIAVIATILTANVKYVVEAYQTFREILGITKEK